MWGVLTHRRKKESTVFDFGMSDLCPAGNKLLPEEPSLPYVLNEKVWIYMGESSRIAVR